MHLNHKEKDARIAVLLAAEARYIARVRELEEMCRDIAAYLSGYLSVVNPPSFTILFISRMLARHGISPGMQLSGEPEPHPTVVPSDMNGFMRPKDEE